VDGNVQCINRINITYSLKVFENASTSINLYINPLTSFFDIMKIAQDVDLAFSFTYTSHDLYGAYITSIGDLYEDIPAYLVWLLYKCDPAAEPATYPEGCELSQTAASKGQPKRNGWH
ncbi:unnamed protein product, partial [Meganyctiphanes norvegica]